MDPLEDSAGGYIEPDTTLEAAFARGQATSRARGPQAAKPAFRVITFGLTEEQTKKYIAWALTKPVSDDALGTQFEFLFIPTSLGTICKVKCLVTQDELDLTDYSTW